MFATKVVVNEKDSSDTPRATFYGFIPLSFLFYFLH